MNTTRTSASRTTAVAALLAGTLALGACGTATSTDDSPARPQADVIREQAAAAGVDASSAARQALRLQRIRYAYPTAGLEVPPASLTAQPSTTDPGASIPDRSVDVPGPSVTTLRRAE